MKVIYNVIYVNNSATIGSGRGVKRTASAVPIKWEIGGDIFVYRIKIY